jgi:hypothetical protein
VTRSAPWTPRRGTFVTRARKQPRTRSSGSSHCSLARGHVLRSVQGPVLVDRQCSHSEAKASEKKERRVERSVEVEQTGKPEEPTERLRSTDEARLGAHHHLARGSRDASEKEGGCGLRPFEDQESSGRSARTSYAVAEVVRGDVRSRISSRAAPSKRERGGSERGPSAR